MPDAEGKADKETRSGPAKPIHAVVDRIEDGGMAVLMIGDDEQMQIDLPMAMLPEGIHDGDHLKITITIDRPSRVAAADRIKKLQEQLTKESDSSGQKSFKL